MFYGHTVTGQKAKDLCVSPLYDGMKFQLHAFCTSQRDISQNVLLHDSASAALRKQSTAPRKRRNARPGALCLPNSFTLQSF